MWQRPKSILLPRTDLSFSESKKNMSEYAKQCPKYINVYYVKQERNCINCLYSDDANWSTCAIDEMKWKQQRFMLSQVMGQKTLEDFVG